MNQSALYRSVARCTGESVGFVRRMGFVLLVPPPTQHDEPEHTNDRSFDQTAAGAGEDPTPRCVGISRHGVC